MTLSADDPYRWATVLLAEGLSREDAQRRMVAGGVEGSMASEILESIERNRPRPRPLRMVFGALLLVAAGFTAFMMKPRTTGILAVAGLFALWDGFRGKR